MTFFVFPKANWLQLYTREVDKSTSCRCEIYQNEALKSVGQT